MPFKSKRQQRFMFATMPGTAKEWADKTDFSKLPEKVKHKKKDKSDAHVGCDGLKCTCPCERCKCEHNKDTNDVFQGKNSLEAEGAFDVDDILVFCNEYARQVLLS